MKKTYFLFLVVMVFSCSPKPSNKQNQAVLKEEKGAINVVLNNWHKSASEANFETYFKAMSNNSRFIGTDASENWDIAQFKSFSKPFFDKGKAWDFKPIERNVYVDSNTSYAWFDELLNTWMGVCRGSGVLKKRGKSWVIKHYVLSVTIPNDNIKDVIEITKKHDSVFVLNHNKTIH